MHVTAVLLAPRRISRFVGYNVLSEVATARTQDICHAFRSATAFARQGTRKRQWDGKNVVQQKLGKFYRFL